MKVLDRSGVILDIFAQRAQTHEGRIQVELAQLEYQLPRLTRLWTHLSRMGGGIGTRRGPGETQLETDRRVIRERIKKTRERVEEVRRRRETAARARERRLLPTVAIVGYTNAGKSTLLNALVGEEAAVVEDMLFATLDPTTPEGAAAGGADRHRERHGGFHPQAAAPVGRGLPGHPGGGDTGRRAVWRWSTWPTGTPPSTAARCRPFWTSWGRVTSRGWWCSTRPISPTTCPVVAGREGSGGVLAGTIATPCKVSALSGAGIAELRSMMADGTGRAVA